MRAFAVFTLVLSLCAAEIFFSEKFDEGYEERWVQPTKWKPMNQMGKWAWTAGEWYGDAADKGIKTSEDVRFYGYSAKMEKQLNNEGKDLVLQYTTKYEQKIDCGGAYIKVLPDGLDQDKFSGDSPYAIMFGPDVCGGKRKTHVILNYKGENYQSKKEFHAIVDNLTHMYTLILHPDNTYEYRIDGKKENEGSLYEDWDMLPPRTINDPNDSKPEDWDDQKLIPDPEDVKPEDWDDIPSEIPDPNAVKPEDWDDEDDGEWEPPMIPNPEYRGEWEPNMIENPNYQGEWAPRVIDNPDFVDDPLLYNVCKDCNYVGFELWQVLSGSVFDDIIVTDSVEEAEAFANETFFVKRDAEKKMYEEMEEEKRRAEAEAAAAAADDEEEEEEEEEEEAEEEEVEVEAEDNDEEEL